MVKAREETPQTLATAIMLTGVLPEGEDALGVAETFEDGVDVVAVLRGEAC